MVLTVQVYVQYLPYFVFCRYLSSSSTLRWILSHFLSGFYHLQISTASSIFGAFIHSCRHFISCRIDYELQLFRESKRYNMQLVNWQLSVFVWDRKPLRCWMNSLSSWSQRCRMGGEQEVNHWRIVAYQETGCVLLRCWSKSTEAEPRAASTTGGLKIARNNIKNRWRDRRFWVKVHFQIIQQLVWEADRKSEQQNKGRNI